MMQHPGFGNWCNFCSILLLFFTPIFLQAQAPTYHPWDWEIGLRNTNLTDYYRTVDGLDRFNRRGPIIGWEVYLLQRRPNHTFSRLGIGYGSDVLESEVVDGQIVNSPVDQEQVLRRFAATAEAGFGWELPHYQHGILNRIRFRAGLSLAIQFFQSQSYRAFQVNAIGDYGYFHLISSGSSLWHGTAFGQFQFQLFKGAFVGLEWRFGPRMHVGKQDLLREDLYAGQSGYYFSREITPVSRLHLSFSNQIGLPIFSLSYSL